MHFRIGVLAVALTFAGSATAQKIIGPDKPLAPVSKVQAGPGGGPHTATTLSGTLAAAGRFNTFLAIIKAAGMDDWERSGFCDGSVRGWDGGGKTGFCDGSVRGLTVLAPNDAAFAKMDKAKLVSLTSDKAAARAFFREHVVAQPLKVSDMFEAGNLNSEKHFKAAGGGELKLLCNGFHDGMHHPRINGLAKVADLQDVQFKGGIVQEIDGVLQP